jgi:hypothetical protein
VAHSDNFFDLLLGGSKSVDVEIFLSGEQMRKVAGAFVVEGTNIQSHRVLVEFVSA